MVFECTGIFPDKEGPQKHIQAGAGRAILSAPAKGGGVSTVVHGVNAPGPDAEVISCASCTTNAITPVVEVTGRRVGVSQ